MDMTELWIRRSMLILVLWLVAGCENLPVEDVVAAGSLERWGCGDYIDGCWFGGCPVKLTADFHNGIGTVEFAGTVNHARFEIKGLGRRWDWCLQDDGSFGCAFVIDAGGDGSYFDFTRVMPDPDGRSRAKPSDLFSCTRRRVRDS